MSEKEAIAKALRALVGSMFRDLRGAYGAEAYEGQYEAEIQALAEAIINATLAHHKRELRK